MAITYSKNKATPFSLTSQSNHIVTASNDKVVSLWNLSKSRTVPNNKNRFSGEDTVPMEVCSTALHRYIAYIESSVGVRSHIVGMEYSHFTSWMARCSQLQKTKLWYNLVVALEECLIPIDS